MTRRLLIGVWVVLLLACVWGCQPPPKSIRWGSGCKGYRSGYTVVYTYVDETLDALIFFSEPIEGFSSCDGLAGKNRNVYDATYGMEGSGYRFRVTRDVETGVMEIGGRAFQMAAGPVFLCEIGEGGVAVSQVSENIASGYVEFYFPEDAVDKLIEGNPAVMQFVQKLEFRERGKCREEETWKKQEN